MITDLKELEKLMKLCRKQGISEFEIDNIRFKLGDLPIDNKSVEKEDTSILTDVPDISFFPDEYLNMQG